MCVRVRSFTKDAGATILVLPSQGSKISCSTKAVNAQGRDRLYRHNFRLGGYFELGFLQIEIS